VHLLRGLKPEFGYFCPSPNLRRKLSVAIAFTIFGLVAGASSLALLVADDPDPRSAFAFAPQSPSREPETLATTAELPAVDAVRVRKITKSCRRNALNDDDASCDSGVARKPGVVPAVTNPPAAAELPIGHGGGPAGGAPAAAGLVASTPPLDAAVPEPTDGVVASPVSVAEAPGPEASPAQPAQTSAPPQQSPLLVRRFASPRRLRPPALLSVFLVRARLHQV
jgi:hypothetical protein